MAIENIAFDCLRNQFLSPFSCPAVVTNASNSLAAEKRASQIGFLSQRRNAKELVSRRLARRALSRTRLRRESVPRFAVGSVQKFQQKGRVMVSGWEC
jgi:hypothetical protein